MKKVLSILVVVLFVGSMVAQQAPQKTGPAKSGEKAKTETVKHDCKAAKSDSCKKTCCDKSKAGCCKGAKPDSSKCTVTKKASCPNHKK
jgi:hypothetical protein